MHGPFLRELLIIILIIFFFLASEGDGIVSVERTDREGKGILAISEGSI